VTFTGTTDGARRRAGARFRKLIDQVRVRPGLPDMPLPKIARTVDEDLKAVSRTRRNRLHVSEIEPLHSEASATAGVLR
jgi:hypothetical protein